MSFSLGYVATIIFKNIHSSNDSITPCSATNNALNVKGYCSIVAQHNKFND